MFRTAEFTLSVAKKEQLPQFLDKRGDPIPEVAFVGRSNVGKSSLLNHLAQKKDLARVSSTPGKTQLINFFQVEEKVCLVDLPGYGFAKIAKSKRETWGELIQGYLEDREELKLILLLIDSRMPPSKDDLAFAKWAIHFEKPMVIVFTKTDKLKKSQMKHLLEKHFALLQQEMGGTTLSHVPYSIKDGKGRNALTREIGNYLQWD